MNACSGFTDKAGTADVEVRLLRLPPAPSSFPSWTPRWFLPPSRHLGTDQAPSQTSDLPRQTCSDSDRAASQGPRRSGGFFPTSRPWTQSMCPVSPQVWNRPTEPTANVAVCTARRKHSRSVDKVVHTMCLISHRPAPFPRSLWELTTSSTK